MELEIFSIVLVVTFFIGTAIYKSYAPKIRGAQGEKSVARRLKRLLSKKYKVFNNIYLKLNDRTTEIDHLIVSIYGIFVVETKTYKGWIHGREKSEYWTQSFYKKKGNLGIQLIKIGRTFTF